MSIGADGTSLVTIIPNYAFYSNLFVANGPYLPFISVSTASSTVPFAVAPAFTGSPFNSQFNNTSTYAIDSVQIDFLNTQSPLNVTGRYNTAFFY